VTLFHIENNQTKVAQATVTTFAELVYAAKSEFKFAAVDMHHCRSTEKDSLINSIDDESEWRPIVAKAHGLPVFVRVFEGEEEFKTSPA